jgi:hypothetical protein
MKIYIPCSDQYHHLIYPYSVFFNKYWQNQEVTILCYNKPDIALPDNFKLLSIGGQIQDRTKFMAPLFNYFTNVCQDDYFIFSLEDMFLVDYVNKDKMAKLEKEIKEGRADKAVLHFYNEGQVFDIGNDIVELKQDIHYRTSIHPAIWTRKYLLKHLRPTMNLWEFETQHNNTKNDGAKIIFLKEQLNPTVLFWSMNIYCQGRFLSHEFRTIPDASGNGLKHEEDVFVLKKLLKA